MTKTNNQTPSYGYKNLKINYGVHVVFSTIPHQIDSNFETVIENHYFDNYRKDINSEKTIPFLYKPLKFYMLGNYDVCYISLINNFKLSHRLFEPKSDKSKVYNTHAFQSFSGFALNGKDNINNRN